MPAAVSPPLSRLDRLDSDLRNWGRWVRASDDRLGYPPHGCVANYVHTKRDTDDWTLDYGTDEPGVDELRAVATDADLRRLRAVRRHAFYSIRCAYALRRYVDHLDLDAALRALVDLGDEPARRSSLVNGGRLDIRG